MATRRRSPGRSAGRGSSQRRSARSSNRGRSAGSSPWSAAEMKELRRLVSQNTPTRVIGLKLGRSETSIYSKAARERISLKPANQSPYG
jgi:hypothetical protein